MTAVGLEGRDGPLAALAAVRIRLTLVVALLGLAGLGWWRTVEEMRGMDRGPWTGLGSAGWFLGVWVVMMAAMMLPSVAPTLALYSKMTRRRSPVRPLVFASGYLLSWAGAGLVALAVGRAVGTATGTALAWDRLGRPLAGTTLLVAALYQVTPFKEACLGKCRSPLGFLLGTWRDGNRGAMLMGAKHGAWCVGCCWALMASLFALGVMSVPWMAVVAGVIAVEKTLPWRHTAKLGTALILSVLGVMLLAAPGAIPALTIPHAHPAAGMGQMTP